MRTLNFIFAIKINRLIYFMKELLILFQSLVSKWQ